MYLLCKLLTEIQTSYDTLILTNFPWVVFYGGVSKTETSDQFLFSVQMAQTDMEQDDFSRKPMVKESL